MALRVLADDVRRFVASARVGRLATSSPDGLPHAIPVCFVLLGDSIYIGLDAKPKSVDVLKLRRVRNITSNPRAAFIVDRYSDDWSTAWLRAHHRGCQLSCLTTGASQRDRRPEAQVCSSTGLFSPMRHHVIRLRLRGELTSWGDLTPWRRSCDFKFRGPYTGRPGPNIEASAPHDRHSLRLRLPPCRNSCRSSAVAVISVCFACGGVDGGVPDNAELRRGIELQEDGHIEQAFHAYSSAIESDPRNAEAYARRAYVYIVMDDLTSAAADLRIADKLDPRPTLDFASPRHDLR